MTTKQKNESFMICNAHNFKHFAKPLASAGGPKAVTIRYRDNWKSCWWKDAVAIAKQLKWGFTTCALREGVIAEFENRFASLTGCKYALAMNSGTATLHSALFAVGVGPGDEVILPAYTWHSTASAILCCGGRPVFCDINPQTLTADPEDISRRISPRTKAIVVVHVWGNPAQLDAISDIANSARIPLIEDCSHAHGAIFKGRPVGSWGDIGCFSLQGGKAVSAGEGGIAVTNKRELYEYMLALGHPIRAGTEIRTPCTISGNLHLGPKYRPHLFGMILALSSLDRLPILNQLRQKNWDLICSLLDDCHVVRPTYTFPGAQRGGFLEFKLLVDASSLNCSMDQLVHDLRAEGVPVSIDRYGTLHKTLFFLRGGPITLDLLHPSPSIPLPNYHLPNLEKVEGSILTLPAFTAVDQRYVVQCVDAIRKVADAHRTN